jgi:hypothetical protein
VFEQAYLQSNIVCILVYLVKDLVCCVCTITELDE